MEPFDFVDTHAFGINSVYAMIVYVRTRSTKDKIVQSFRYILPPLCLALCCVEYGTEPHNQRAGVGDDCDREKIDNEAYIQHDQNEAREG